MDSANKIVNLLYNAEMFLTCVEQTTFEEHVLRFGRHMQLCRSIAAEEQEPLWHLTPKVHLVQHLPRQAKLINPRMVQNYMEEGFIGKVTKIWASAKNGLYLRTVQRTVLMKLLLGLQLQFEIPVSATLRL